MAEYYIRKIDEFHYTVAKFTGYKRPEQVYTIRGRTLASMNCNCPASHRDPNCKHRWMLQGWIDNLTDKEKVSHYFSDEEDAFVQHPFLGSTITNLMNDLEHTREVATQLRRTHPKYKDEYKSKPKTPKTTKN